MVNKTLSCFKDKNLYSKKEWLFSDKIIFTANFFTPIILFVLLFYLCKSIVNIKYNKIITIPIILIISLYIADLLSACIHCFYIDNSYRYNKFKFEDTHMIINTEYGYASCHHIFPSNWKDIKDSTLLSTTIILSTIPIILVIFFINNSVINSFTFSESG